MINRKTPKFVSPRNSKPSVCTGPNPNQSVLSTASSGSRISPNATMVVDPRRRFNQTICMSTNMKKPPLKIPKRDDNTELQLTFLYNDYLQSLMHQLMIEQKSKKDGGIWNGQLRHYEDLLQRKQKELDTIISDTKSIEKRKEVSEKYTCLCNQIFSYSHQHNFSIFS